jgi:Tfp pilus assembly protein PilE
MLHIPSKIELKTDQIQAGFTFMEMMMVLALFIIVSSISMMAYGNLMPVTDLRESAYHLTEDLRRAETYSRSAYNNQSWGVYVDNSQKKSTLYQGNSYATRNATFDQVYKFNSQVNITLPTSPLDMHFTRYTGFPNATGTIVFSIQSGNTQSITINSLGVVDFD